MTTPPGTPGSVLASRVAVAVVAGVLPSPEESLDEQEVQTSTAAGRSERTINLDVLVFIVFLVRAVPARTSSGALRLLIPFRSFFVLSKEGACYWTLVLLQLQGPKDVKNRRDQTACGAGAAAESMRAYGAII